MLRPIATVDNAMAESAESMEVVIFMVQLQRRKDHKMGLSSSRWDIFYNLPVIYELPPS